MADTVAIKLPRRFYTVEQLANRWECKIEDIEHLIEVGELMTADKGAARYGKKTLMLRFFWDPYAYNDHLGDESFSDEYTIPIFDEPGSGMTEAGIELFIKEQMGVMASQGELEQVILASEVLRLEREHGDQAGSTTEDELRQTASRNIPDHPCYSEELAIAVAAWSELYSESDGKKPNQGHKKYIEAWLRENHPKLSSNSIDRISTMINPLKSGGAPSTQ